MSEKHLLAIDTVSDGCTVALSKQNFVLQRKTVVADKGYSEIIIPLIEDILDECQLNINQLTAFLVCTGPGNYTSLRIAISTVRGLSLACKKPACGISLFELLSTTEHEILVLIKGPREKLYVQNFSNGVQINAPRLMTLNEITKTTEFYGLKTIGYKAKEVGKLLNCSNYLEATEISFKKFFALGINKLKKSCPRPAPLYIK